jgi:putative Mn2+ efflux pump MntP
MLWAGLSAGHYGQRMLGGFARVVSGVLLVAVGVYEIRL